MIVGAAIYLVAGGVEAGYSGNGGAADAGGMLFLFGLVALIVGMVGVVAAGLASASRRSRRR